MSEKFTLTSATSFELNQSGSTDWFVRDEKGEVVHKAFTKPDALRWIDQQLAAYPLAVTEEMVAAFHEAFRVSFAAEMDGRQWKLPDGDVDQTHSVRKGIEAALAVAPRQGNGKPLLGSMEYWILRSGLMEEKDARIAELEKREPARNGKTSFENYAIISNENHELRAKVAELEELVSDLRADLSARQADIEMYRRLVAELEGKK